MLKGFVSLHKKEKKITSDQCFYFFLPQTILLLVTIGDDTDKTHVQACTRMLHLTAVGRIFFKLSAGLIRKQQAQ